MVVLIVRLSGRSSLPQTDLSRQQQRLYSARIPLADKGYSLLKAANFKPVLLVLDPYKSAIKIMARGSIVNAKACNLDRPKRAKVDIKLVFSATKTLQSAAFKQPILAVKKRWLRLHLLLA